MIRWRLREVMARYSVKSAELSRELGISANSVSSLRKASSTPRLDGDALNRLCNALNKLAKDREQVIGPAMLMIYIPDDALDDTLTQ